MGLGSGIREKPIPDPGVKKAQDPGSGSATLLYYWITVRIRNRNTSLKANLLFRTRIRFGHNLLLLFINWPT